MANIPELIETVKSMTVLELNDFVKALQEEFGVSAMASKRRLRLTLSLPLLAVRRFRSSRSYAS
jgi:ribosomal protein L7/L12